MMGANYDFNILYVIFCGWSDTPQNGVRFNSDTAACGRSLKLWDLIPASFSNVLNPNNVNWMKSAMRAIPPLCYLFYLHLLHMWRGVVFFTE